MTDSNTREERIALLASLNASSTKFMAKLSFDQRCEILALRHLGVRRDVLSKMYNVDRRTITHIYNPMSPHYKNVRAEEAGVGREAFRNTYVSNELLAIALEQSAPKEEGNNKEANRMAGLHTVQGKNCTYAHRVYINWIEAGQHKIEVSGWYYRDVDSDFPEDWFTAGDADSLKSSRACYMAMLNDISDKLV